MLSIFLANVKNIKRTSVFRILSKFSITLNVLISVNCFILIGFNEATLDLHLRTVKILKIKNTKNWIKENVAQLFIIINCSSHHCHR